MSHRLLYDWFADSVAPFFDEVALEVDEHVLSYAELDTLVRAIAVRLLRFHGGVPARVGLAASRSRTAYAGYLAILRLGATPVPLNAGFPDVRNRAIAVAAGLEAVIRDASGARTEAGVPALDLPDVELAGVLPLATADLPASAAGPDDLAYILFPSGWTGTPKGVPVTHRNVSPFIAHARRRCPAGPGSRLSQVEELTFGPSVHDMFLAWSSGAALVVPTREDVLSPVEFVNRRRLTHWSSAPSAISAAERLGELTAGAMPCLRWSRFSGEPLGRHQAANWRRAAPHSVLDNVYGPTELAGCCEHRVAEGNAEKTANGTLPIGTPCPGMEYAIVGENGFPAQVGELIMRGVQRFPGYLDPTHNVGKFMELSDGRARVYQGDEPLRADHWYRTGDRVSLSNGVVIHLGRIDHQVKIRGHRVEIGEIQDLIRQQYGVRDAVVLGQPNKEGDIELRAAFTGLDIDPGEVLTELGRQVPAHMVPRSLTRFDELPLNVHGRVDRPILARVLFHD